MIQENKDLIRTFEDIKANEKSNQELVIDARAPSEFYRDNPRAPDQPNHIENSINVPYANLFDPENGTLKNRQEILNCIHFKIVLYSFLFKLAIYYNL